MAKRRTKHQVKSELVIHHKKGSIVAEQFRTIRTNLKFSLFDIDCPAIVITSATSDSGKSFVAANLAAFFASEECKVLLVDSDLRKPRQHKIFGTENQDGLSSLIINKEKILSEVINVTSSDKLWLLTSGPIPPNPSELLMRELMDKVIEDARKSFDMIIFDLPPILAVTDAQIMASKTDGTVFVVPRGRVKKIELFRSKELLDNVNAKVLGSVLNFTDKKEDSYKYGEKNYY